MHPFVQNLESRTLLSAAPVHASPATLAADRAKVTKDLVTLSADFRNTASAVTRDSAKVQADVQKLAPQSNPLVAKLTADAKKYAALIGKDVSALGHAGSADAVAIEGVAISLYTDAGNAAKTAADEARLTADLRKLQSDTAAPLSTLKKDLAAAEAALANDLKPIAAALQKDITLKADVQALADAATGGVGKATADLTTLGFDLKKLAQDQA